ncbi:MAG TPA: metalloregulator ArsR/SmtB family transcription factor, partial [Rhodanobacteraceae bacterium]|nr:metalloregulator ArsR/SmtB family transcription factor [Rhodanobacteraceae bacterium]
IGHPIGGAVDNGRICSGCRRSRIDAWAKRTISRERLSGVAPQTTTQLASGRGLHVSNRWRILNHMVQCLSTRFDASFAALSDVTRRGVLEQLGRADASITQLAEKFRMTLTGMKKHVGVLEQAGLVTTQKVGRVRTCRLGLRRLEEEAAWIQRYRQLWDARFAELDEVIEELKRKEKIDERKKRK